MMHYIIKYNRANGRVEDVKEFEDWTTAFKEHQAAITAEPNPDVSISLVDAPDLEKLHELYGAFFHKK